MNRTGSTTSLVCGILIAAAAGLGMWTRPTALAAGFDAKTARFSLEFRNELAAYREMSAFLLPGATLEVQAVQAPAGGYVLSAPAGTITRHGPRRWLWRAPMLPGLYDLVVDGPLPSSHDDQRITLHAFVMVPAADVRGGVLNGYRIGSYPSRPLNGNPIYRAPAGFIEVTRDNQDTKVSPHFRLRQFLCKCTQEAAGRFPKYVVLQERLILELETILAHANAMGFDIDTFNVMSAYRTPFYNHAIGDVEYSMHQWGGAADIFIDKHGKGVMDDLNRDRRIDRQDAQWLADEIEKLLALPSLRRFTGGLGVYPATSAHPPFVHVDVRGTRARWQG